MKKWVFLAVLVFGIGYPVIKMPAFFQDNVEIKKYDQAQSGFVDTYEEVRVTKEDIYRGNLLLVNAEHPMKQESKREDVVNLQHDLTMEVVLLDSEIELSEGVALAFGKMVAAAEKEGVHHFSINSGYRDFQEQSLLYEEMGSDYALPAGYSEHNLGVSLDVGSTKAPMNEAPEGKWIEENAWKSGFILRYPKDKTHVTGIQYEPWHIRYVGLPHSAIIQEKNFALEEYLDYLTQEKNIIATFKGQKYTVSYYTVSESETIQLPKNQAFEISGNNMDGVIVTVQE
ncbi:M15 family metallopeptidase [Neobacillus sp. FSL H8-0543]|uniref:M15 family metallopeptidase n=1 Tax=Neobacillus sp. FSL H8-0543 TaxID=2954672 RepID=UPI003158F90F